MTQDSNDAGKRPGIDLDAQTQALTPGQEKARTTDGHSRIDEPTTTASIGDYRIIRKIGEGGMGVVYEAEQQRPRRRVALKVIRGGLASDDRHVKMFEREIEALARLKHPGIASIYESGRSDDGQMFFAMEFVEGIDLGDFVERRRTLTGELPSVDDQLRLFFRIAEVVSYAHLRGIIHRDLKPQNILVTDDGEALATMSGERVGVKILDFGLARINDPEFRGNTAASEVGQIKGTLLYMSPEQLKGRPDDIDVRSDVYALGVMLYEMLTGRIPYDLTQASLPEAMRIICEDPPIPLIRALTEAGTRSARIDRDVETIVLKALEKEPEHRYQSVAAMLEDVERYLTSQPILARPPSPYYQFRKLVARHRAAFASLAVIFVLLLGFGIAMAAQSIRIANERDRALNAEAVAEDRKTDALKARNDALIARDEEAKQRDLANENFLRAEAEKTKAFEAQRAAEDSLREARRQKDIADTKKLEAEIAAEETKLAEGQAILKKKEAEHEVEKNRRLLYVSQMNLASQAWDQADSARVTELLERQIPGPNQDDLRDLEWYHLWYEVNRHAFNYKPAESMAISAAGFSPNGEYLAIEETPDKGSVRQVVRFALWNTSTWRLVKSYERRRFLTFTPRGEVLTIGEGGRVEKIDPSTDIVTASPVSNANGQVAFSPDKKLMVRRHDDGTAEFWNLVEEKRLLAEHAVKPDLEGVFFASGIPFFPRGLRLSADGRYIAVPGRGLQTITLWDTASGQQLRTLGSGRTADFQSIAFGNQGTSFATQGSGTKLWDLTADSVVAELETARDLKALGQTLSYLTFARSGSVLATANGRAVRVWDMNSRREIALVRGLGQSVAYMDFSPDGEMLVATAFDGLKVWNLKDVSEPPSKGGFDPVVSPDEKTMVVRNMLGISLVAAQTEKVIQEIAKYVPGRTATSPPKFSENGKLLGWTRSEQGKECLDIWVVATGVLEPCFISKAFIRFDFSPDGSKIAVMGELSKEEFIELWDFESKRQIYAAKGPRGELMSAGAVFSPDSKLLIYAVPGASEILDIEKLLRLPSRLPFSIGYQSKISPDGKLLAVSSGKDVRVVEFGTWRELFTLRADSNHVTSVEFSPSGFRLATLGSDQLLKFWDLRTGQAALTLRSESQSVKFMADGRSFVTTGIGGLRSWKGASDEQVAAQRGK